MSASAACSSGSGISSRARPWPLALPSFHPNGRPPPWCLLARRRLRLASLMRSEIIELRDRGQHSDDQLADAIARHVTQVEQPQGDLAALEILDRAQCV